MPAIKVKVVRPSPETASPGLAPRPVTRLRAEDDALVLEPELGRHPFDRLRFLAVAGDAPALLLFVAGRDEPLWVPADVVDHASFALPPPVSPAAGLRRLTALLCRRCPELRLDRQTFDFLAGGEPASLPASPAAYAAGVAALLTPADDEERIDAARFFAVEPERTPAEPQAVAAAAPGAAAAPVAPSSPLATPPAGSRITCPHCGQTQEPATKCRRCGVIFAKYDRALADDGPRAAPDIPDDARAALESPSRWGVTFLAAESVGEILLGVLRGHAPALVAIVAAAWLPAILLAALPPALGAGPTTSILIAFVLANLAYSLSVMGVVAHVDRILGGRPVDAGAALGQAWRALPGAISGRLLATARILLGLAALVIPGVIYALRGAFVEIFAVLEPGGRAHVTRGQLSRNLVTGFELSTLGQLTLVAAAGGAAVATPLYLAWLLDLLGLEFLAPLSSLPFQIFLGLAVTVLACLAFAAFAVVLYLLFRELRDQQGPAIDLLHEGIGGLSRFVLVVDLVLLLLFIYRTSGLVQ